MEQVDMGSCPDSKISHQGGGGEDSATFSNFLQRGLRMLEAPPAVGLTYVEFHLFYTVPMTFALWLIVRPFMDKSLWMNTTIISVLALVYTTPWDNIMVLTSTWAFPENAVWLTIGYVPLEEYFFFVIQTVMVIFWSVLCLRWKLPGLYLRVTSHKANLVRWTPIPFIVACSVFCWTNYIEPETPFFYFRCVIGWTFPVVAFLWIGTGNYIVQRFRSVMVALIPSSIYLIFVDSMAISVGVWHVNPKSVTGIYIRGSMPIEEAFFFFAVNVLIVFGFCATEKSMAILHNYPEEFKGKNILMKMFAAFFRLESFLNPERIEDLQLTLQVLRRASKSFWSASLIFPTGLRQDLSVLYAFCRVTDDMVDDICLSKKQKEEKLSLIREFLDKLFENRESNGKHKYGVTANSKPPSIDWSYYKVLLSHEELAAFRCLSRIADQIPVEPLYELCRGYEWDITGKLVKTKDDVIEYSEYVASSVGVLCTFLMVNERRDWFANCEAKPLRNRTAILEAARQMGAALQLTNIARDIVTDSETLGRCYVPEDFMQRGDIDALQKRNPWSLGQKTLRSLSLTMLDLGEEMKANAAKGIEMLPASMRPGIIAATEIYTAIGNSIRASNGYPKRASVSKFGKICILLRAIYFPNFQH